VITVVILFEGTLAATAVSEAEVEATGATAVVMGEHFGGSDGWISATDVAFKFGMTLLDSARKETSAFFSERIISAYDMGLWLKNGGGAW